MNEAAGAAVRVRVGVRTTRQNDTAERQGRTTRPSPLLPGEVKIVLDKELMGAARIGCHPLSNAATCVLAPDQLMQATARVRARARARAKVD